jgi:hypothetical protein
MASSDDDLFVGQLLSSSPFEMYRRHRRRRVAVRVHGDTHRRLEGALAAGDGADGPASQEKVKMTRMQSDSAAISRMMMIVIKKDDEAISIEAHAQEETNVHVDVDADVEKENVFFETIEAEVDVSVGGFLSVTDLSASQWCLLQFDYALKTGRKVRTDAMVAGSQRHAEIEFENNRLLLQKVPVGDDREEWAVNFVFFFFFV